MTMLIVAKAWLIAVITGLILLYPRESRCLSVHLLLGSTIGLVLSFVALGLAASPLAMAAGGLLGVFIGSRLAVRLNLALGWQTPK